MTKMINWRMRVKGIVNELMQRGPRMEWEGRGLLNSAHK
jgi:hypothetical protein